MEDDASCVCPHHSDCSQQCLQSIIFSVNLLLFLIHSDDASLQFVFRYPRHVFKRDKSKYSVVVWSEAMMRNGRKLTMWELNTPLHSSLTADLSISCLMQLQVVPTQRLKAAAMACRQSTNTVRHARTRNDNVISQYWPTDATRTSQSQQPEARLSTDFVLRQKMTLGTATKC